MKRFLWVVFLFMLITSAAFGSDWELFTCQNDINDIAQYGDVFWLATCGGALRWDRNTGQIDQYDAIDFGFNIGYQGLNEVANSDDGFLCFGGYDYILTFDGILWKKYDIPGTVNDMDYDSNGVLWIATTDCVARFENENYLVYTYDEEGYIGGGAESVVVGPDNTVWFAADSGGLFSFDGEIWTAFTPDNSGLADKRISGLSFDQNGVLWILNNEVICTYDGNSWETLTTDIHGPKSWPLTKFTQVVDFDSQGRVWFGSYQGLVMYDGNYWFIYSTENSGLSQDPIRALIVDETDGIWISTGRRGAFRSFKFGLDHLNGSEWNNIMFPGPKGNGVQAVFVDHNNDVWLQATSADPNTARGLGTSHFDGSQWHNIENEDVGKSGNLYYNGIAEDQNNILWIVGWNDVYRYDGQEWTTYTEEDGLIDNHVYDIAVDQNNVKWFGTNNGLYSFDDEVWKNYGITDNFERKQIMVLAFDNDNVLWCATSENGVLSFDGDEWSNFTVEDGLVNNSIGAIAIDQNNVKWFGADPHSGFINRGISSVDGEEWTTYSAIHEGHSYPHRVNSIVVDNNNIKWLGPRNRFDGETWDINNEDGLISTISYANDAVLAPDGTIWFGTNSGLLHYIGNGDFPTAVETPASLPQPLKITAIYPNPFNNSTTVSILSDSAISAEIQIYNLLGQSVRSINQIELHQGNNSLIWDGANDDGNIVSSGKYFIRLKADEFFSTAGVTFLR